MSFNPPPVGPDWREWARQVGRQLSRMWPNLQWRTQRDIPAENGILLWDEDNEYPVVSRTGVFVPVLLSGSPPSAHTHVIADTTGLQTALDGKAATSHSHVIADTTGLQTALDAKQAIASLATTVQAYTLDTFANPVASLDFAQQQTLQFVIENRTSDPGSPVTGQLWIRTDL